MKVNYKDNALSTYVVLGSASALTAATLPKR